LEIVGYRAKKEHIAYCTGEILARLLLDGGGFGHVATISNSISELEIQQIAKDSWEHAKKNSQWDSLGAREYL
jgi:hypothetical protein